ncbi:beta-glucosidase [Parabacteroides sp. PM6-13]|uniref:beta-glucosidase n=1 Tax=Parabacteroides sp. PM6-13 TaxID=1742408 RepID=UPI0024760548|nr:glycoside hydrolase family 3 C-terminal domain-containing protein [Parabacteroides sp. PM6-13]MDH6343097.1 beta-glucosidase [Parabacteroides sp. PM6-13]
MKKQLFIPMLACIAILFLPGCAQKYEYPFQDPKLPIDKRVENLLSLLTPEEKAGLMINSSKPVERLGIPAYDWWNEALHGVARAGRATVFPQAIGMAAAWNEAGHLETFDIISDEARAKYNEAMREDNHGRYYGLTFWTPNINIFRDPRWGRGQETYGEDPYLTARLGVAAVKGLQGSDPNYYKSHACAKHYAVHSGPEWNRHSYDAIATGRDLWETYLPAFQALVQEGNVREVMCAYNAYEGQPCCGSDVLLNDILRNQWKFDGMVVSDCWAINDFFLPNNHATHEDAAAAAADAVIHTTDLECGSVYENLVLSMERGLITEAQVDESLRRVLRGWFELGMLDPVELVPWSNLPYSIVDSEKHRAQALKVARESMTLLKNNNNVLPLKKDIKRIAVIGPNAADSVMLWGNYNGFPSSTVTILDGIKAKLPNAEIIYDKGCDLVDPWVRTSLYEGFTSEANGSKGLKVDFYNNNTFDGQPVATVINAEGINYNNSGGTALAQGVNMDNTSTRITGLFTAPYTGQVVFSARTSDKYTLFINDKEVMTQSGREASVPSEYPLNVEKGKTYKVKLEHAQTGRRVSIDFSVYRKERAEFTELTNRIKDVDVIIYAGGLSPRLEGEEMPVSAEGFKGGDKVSIDLPGVQRRILADLKKTGKPVVFVLCTGSSLALEQDEKNYDALLCAWYGGQAAGTAVADVLFGDYNPAGRLPVTFYKTLEQLDNALEKTDDPARQGFENYHMTGRTYRYMTEAPLYPFGHGLSYAQFDYGQAKIANKIKATKGATISIPVTNASDKGGDEVVQVYVKRNNDPAAPVKSLRAFERVYIDAGQTKTLELTIRPDAFEFYDEAANGLVAKSGSYTILYGGTSADAGLKKVDVTVE